MASPGPSVIRLPRPEPQRLRLIEIFPWREPVIQKVTRSNLHGWSMKVQVVTNRLVEIDRDTQKCPSWRLRVVIFGLHFSSRSLAGGDSSSITALATPEEVFLNHLTSGGCRSRYNRPKVLGSWR